MRLATAALKQNLSFINDAARRTHLEASISGAKVVQIEANLTRSLGHKVYLTPEAYITACNLMDNEDLLTHYAVEWDAGAAAYLVDTIYTSACLLRELRGTL